jgi:adenylate cyclase class 2
MKEIEVKVIDIDKKEIEKRLRKLKAKKTFDGLSCSICYKIPKKTKNKTHLRLRKEGKSYFITFKSPISDKKVKIKRELEVNVDDFEVMNKIFNEIGVKTDFLFKKYRISYELGKAKIELDKYPGIPWFLEIEAPNINSIYNAAKKLGIGKNELKPWGFKQIKEYYKK